MEKHLLIYDVDWWVLGKHAQLIKQYHPDLEIMSQEQFFILLKQIGPDGLNKRYEVIATMCLGLAKTLIDNGVRVDSSVAVSYYYFIDNHYTFREWVDKPIYNKFFVENYLSKIKSIGAINTNLAEVLSGLSPNTKVKYIKQFVDTDHFRPYEIEKNSDEFVIGWVGDTEKTCKNYYTTYSKIVQCFKNHPQVRFHEATMKSFIPQEKMPEFYHSLNLLVITGNHEGGPAPALEAYASGVPVLSTNVGYVKDITPLDSHDLIINSNNSLDFISKICSLVGKRAELRKLGGILHNHVKEQFSLLVATKEWINTLFLKK